MNVLTRVQMAWDMATFFGRSVTWTSPLWFLLHFAAPLSRGMVQTHGRIYRAIRWLEGARAPRSSDQYEDTSGVYEDCGAYVAFSGACPVQSTEDSEVDGCPAYYRSRGEGWSLEVAATPDGDPFDEDAFRYFERKYAFPDGGWVHRDVSRECIRRGVEVYRAWKRGDQ